jgi:hypothetical protein
MTKSRAFPGLGRPAFGTFGCARFRSIIPDRTPVTARSRLIRFSALAGIGRRHRRSRKINKLPEDGGQSLWL